MVYAQQRDIKKKKMQATLQLNASLSLLAQILKPID